MVDPIVSKPYDILDKRFSILNPIKWDLSSPKTIEVTQGHGTPLQLNVCAISLADLNLDDVPASSHDMFTHPYGLADPAKSVGPLQQFVGPQLWHYFYARVDRSDSLATNVFKMADHMSRKVEVSTCYRVLALMNID